MLHEMSGLFIYGRAMHKTNFNVGNSFKIYDRNPPSAARKGIIVLSCVPECGGGESPIDGIFATRQEVELC